MSSTRDMQEMSWFKGQKERFLKGLITKEEFRDDVDTMEGFGWILPEERQLVFPCVPIEN